MVEFIGNSRRVNEHMQAWGNYFGEAEARAQQQWQNREQRNRYDEANRYNRAEAERMQRSYANQAGLFENMDGMLGGLRPSGAAPITQPNNTGGPLSLTPPGAGISAQGSAAQAAPAQPIVGSNTPTFAEQGMAPVDISELTPAQRMAWDRYVQVTSNTRAPLRDWYNVNRGMNPPVTGGTNQERQAALAQLRAVGLDVSAGTINGQYQQRPMRRIDNYSMEQLRFPETTSAVDDSGKPRKIPTEQAQQPAQAGVGLPGAVLGASAGTDQALNPWYLGTNDTSRGLAPTREMRMLEAQIQDLVGAADLAARHGRVTEAREMFATALQYQAAYHQQGRTVLYRAAHNGNMDAAARLLTEFSGYPEGSVQFAPTDERRTRFSLQIRDNEGRWINASEVPVTRSEVMEGLQALIDAEGAALRNEANSELLQAQIEAGTAIQVANINAAADMYGHQVRAAVAQLDSRTRLALQRGEARMYVNNEDGSAWVVRTDVDEQGNPVDEIIHVGMQEVPSPDTRGRATVRQPVGQRVTGISGVTR